MRMTVAAVGRLKDDPERRLIDRYVRRMGLGKAIALGPLRELELAESRLGTAAERRADEAGRLRSAVADADVLVVLDGKGDNLSSEAFAHWLGDRRDSGARHTSFLIGGPDGHGPAALAGAHLLLSLGPLTLPYGLARVVLIEQVYRALTILTRHPYHRG